MIFKRNKSFDLVSVLDGCRADRGSAQKHLFEQYYGLAKKICLRYAGSSDEVDEMVNDGFLKVFAKIKLYDANQSFEAWFRTVLVRTCIDYYRKNSPKVSLIDIQNAPQIESNDGLIERLSAEEILELVQKLPPSYRMVFSLYVVEGYSHAEIAEMLNINEGTSRSNLVKARHKMQEWVKMYLDENINQNNHV
ncbi:RNA polymerase sigma factor [Lacihabitans sp. LS3-19]|uniref:RNA polymerase sigma factor n=1 Tax=Lacihabitans sp. LS3-19 TaxID=2487335 RepID=UPI0020CB8EE2|nr:RNA polymerase sigma factor [Lacihabitans sp. LS3-19]MCP9768057.1 RNA polymerase sigma factor [Lacihabitans sp. LS3-19]